MLLPLILSAALSPSIPAPYVAPPNPFEHVCDRSALRLGFTSCDQDDNPYSPPYPEEDELVIEVICLPPNVWNFTCQATVQSNYNFFYAQIMALAAGQWSESCSEFNVGISGCAQTYPPGPARDACESAERIQLFQARTVTQNGKDTALAALRAKAVKDLGACCVEEQE